MKINEVFYAGVGTGYIIKKYYPELWYGIESMIAAHQRRAEVERVRIVDVFGDEV